MSIVPLLILVAMFSAWKNDVCEGSMPVPPEGMVTSLGASRPTRAGAPTLYLAISSFTADRSVLVKTACGVGGRGGGGALALACGRRRAAAAATARAHAPLSRCRCRGSWCLLLLLLLLLLLRAPACARAAPRHAARGLTDTDVADELVQQRRPAVVLLLLAVEADGALHHGVLAHEDDALGAQRLGERQGGVAGGAGAAAQQHAGAPRPAAAPAPAPGRAPAPTARMSENCLEPTLSAPTMNAFS